MVTEFELYGPMCNWLTQYLNDKYSRCEIVVVDSHNQRLDYVLSRHNVSCNLAVDIDIQIDVLGIIRSQKSIKLAFIEAKITALTLRDLGQLWAYSKLIDPDEAFLFSSYSLGSLDKIINIYKREDLLDFGAQRIIKNMQIGVWDTVTNAPKYDTLRPRV